MTSETTNEILQDIRKILREIRDKDKEREEKTYYCDQCEEETGGVPAYQINKFTFCSSGCLND
jgi:transcription initiation factor IIE alpha subunit